MGQEGGSGGKLSQLHSLVGKSLAGDPADRMWGPEARQDGWKCSWGVGPQGWGKGRDDPQPQSSFLYNRTWVAICWLQLEGSGRCQWELPFYRLFRQSSSAMWTVQPKPSLVTSHKDNAIWAFPHLLASCVSSLGAPSSPPSRMHSPFQPAPGPRRPF